jgi:hypothetical protein
MAVILHVVVDPRKAECQWSDAMSVDRRDHG